MTKSAVYLETSVVGYATSRLSRDLVVAVGCRETSHEPTRLAALTDRPSTLPRPNLSKY